VLVVVSTAFLVSRTQPAHAISPCTAADATCPVGVNDYYTVPYGQKLPVGAAQGLLANDFGPADSKVEFGGCTDTTSFWTDAAFNVKADGSFNYTPAPPGDIDYPYSGLDSFSYCIIDPTTGLDDQTPVANIAVIPTVRDDSYGTKVNTPLTVTATQDASGVATSGLAGNDSGIDPSSLTLDSTSAQGGTIDDNFDGAFVYTPPPNFQGVDTFNYTGQDWDGDWVDGPFDPFATINPTVPMHGTVTIYVDGTPPTATMSAPGLVTLSTNVSAAWSGTDNPGGTGVANYDMRYSVAPWNGAFGLWNYWRSPTTATSAVIPGTYGRTFCFQARARDRAGNLSAFTPLRCTTIPLRARSLVYTRSWARVTNPVYFSGEAVSTKTNGQIANLPAVQAKRMWLVATKCPTCGTLQVRWNNILIASVNLASPVAVHRALIPIASFPVVRAGTVRLNVTSPSGRAVTIEGLAVLRA
jgi:hypothetical protein